MENTKVSDEISLKDILNNVINKINYLKSKILWIVLAIIIGALLGFYYASSKKVEYISKTNFVLESNDGGSGLGQVAGIASMVGVDIGGSGGGIFKGDNIIELYKSRNIIEKTLLSPSTIDSSKKVIDYYLRFKLNNDSINNVNFIELNQRSRDSLMGRYIKDIQSNYLKVEKLNKKLSIISVTINSPDEDFSYNFNEKLVNNVNEFFIDSKTKKTQSNIKILESKKDSIYSILNGAIYNSVQVIDATPNINPTKLINREVPSKQAQLSIESNKAIYAQISQNLEIAEHKLLYLILY